jgi:hypothetical protein
MFFLIRCVFWLTVVFTTIFSPDPVPQKQPGQEQAVQRPPAASWIGQVMETWLGSALSFMDGKAGHCHEAPGDCLAMAAELSNVAANQRFARALEQSPALPQAAPHLAQVPLPPRRPNILATNEKPGP